MKRLLPLALLLLTLSPIVAQSSPLDLCVIGDSFADEYQGTDNRGGEYHAVTFNWVEQLAILRGVEVGAWGVYSEPRRVGYAQNWARSGAKAADLVGQGQAAGVAAQSCNQIVVWVGTNDYAPAYVPIYDGSFSGAALYAWEAGLVDAITDALDMLPSGNVLQAAIVDFNEAPGVEYLYPNATGRARVSQSIARVNSALQAAALARGYTFANSTSLITEHEAQTVNGIYTIAGVPMCFFCVGNEPHNWFLEGAGSHLGTVSSGLFANWFIDHFAIEIAPLTDAEIVAMVGLALPTETPTPTLTNTPQSTVTATATDAPTLAPTDTSVPTLTPTATLTATFTATMPATLTPSRTPTATRTPSRTPTPAILAVDDTLTTPRNTALNVLFTQLLANDYGSGLSIISGTPPNAGYCVPITGGARCTPPTGYAGAMTFTYTVRNGAGATDVGLVTIAVD